MFNGFELYSRWVPLHLDLLQNVKEHQTPPKGRKAAQAVDLATLLPLPVALKRARSFYSDI